MAEIEEILWKELGVDGASEEQKTIILNRMAETVQNRVAIRLGEELTVDELETFDKTLEKKGEATALGYLEEIFPNYTLVIQEEIEKLKAELSQDMAEIMHRAQSDEA